MVDDDYFLIAGLNRNVAVIMSVGYEGKEDKMSLMFLYELSTI